MKDDYDGNMTRIIKKEVYGLSIGSPAAKSGQALDIACCSVM
jgi:hypothetical protein